MHARHNAALAAGAATLLTLVLGAQILASLGVMVEAPPLATWLALGAAAVFTAVLTVRLLQRTPQRREAQRSLDGINRFQARFLNAAAHELGTPLTPLVLQVHALRRELATADAATQARVAIVERNVGRLSSMVNDLVKGAEMSAVPMQPAHTQADMARVVRDAVQAISPDLRESAIGVGVQVEGATDVAAPPGPLGYVVKNLLREAIQYREPGARVDLTIRSTGPKVHLLLRSAGWKVAQAEWDPGLLMREGVGQASLALYLAAAMADRYGWELEVGLDDPESQVRLCVPAGESWRRPRGKR